MHPVPAGSTVLNPAERFSTAQRQALEQAATWYSILHANRSDGDDHGAWQRWLELRSENTWAWREVEQTLGEFERLPPGLGAHTLLRAGRDKSLSRRSVLKGVLLMLGSTTLGYGGWRYTRQSGWDADLRSSVGERLASTLTDGTKILLNTDSAVDIAYNAGQRRLILRRGELLVTTGHDRQSRPFFIQTPQGTVQALGTRFSVRLRGDHTEIVVFEHQVRLVPEQGQPLLLDSGQQTSMTVDGIDTPAPLDSGQHAWNRGLLVANRQRLDMFLAELSRYREGWLYCDPSIAALRISGTFSLDDTDSALRALVSSLPVRLVQRSHYWVTVVPV